MDQRAQIDSNTVIVGDLNTQRSPIDRSPRQKIKKRNFRATAHIRPMGIMDTYKVFHPKTKQYMSTAHGTFSKIDILGHKVTLNKFKKVEITPCIISE
jgi:exonuclease III